MRKKEANTALLSIMHLIPANNQEEACRIFAESLEKTEQNDN
jgi:hypothetical protein